MLAVPPDLDLDPASGDDELLADIASRLRNILAVPVEILGKRNRRWRIAAPSASATAESVVRTAGRIHLLDRLAAEAPAVRVE